MSPFWRRFWTGYAAGCIVGAVIVIAWELLR